jgi:uncharacterized membrane protein YfcA
LLPSAFADLHLSQLLLIAAMALFAATIGGVSGYGTGALMPLVLVPIVGPEPVVPILAISALFNNSSRAAAFRAMVDWRRVLLVLPPAVPGAIAGAFIYSRLSGRGAAIVIGSMLVGSVPLRRAWKRRGLALSNKGLLLVSTPWGVLAGGTSGAGIMLLSMLMAVGLQGAAVIATDAVISIGMGLAKVSTFGFAGILGPKEIAIAVLMGCTALPGAFLARVLVKRLPLHVHNAILDAVVIIGGAVMIGAAVTG